MANQAAEFEQLLAQTLVPDSAVIKAVRGAPCLCRAVGLGCSGMMLPLAAHSLAAFSLGRLRFAARRRRKT